jgi:ribulose-phosphate 3-epimerase
MREAQICPSILAADLLRLRELVLAAERGGARRFHVDVMDGVFVPNISFGASMVEAVRGATGAMIEAHLMIVEPDRYLDEFAQAGADLITVHQEAGPHLDRTIERIKHLGKKAGVVICPATPVDVLEHVIESVDLVLVMTVNPGFGGQKFIDYTLGKISRVRRMLEARNPGCDLEIDGGVELDTIRRAREAGASVFVAGTAVFGDAAGPAASIRKLLDAAGS